MKSKKTPKPTKEDLIRQEDIKIKMEQENIKLNHPKGKERFIAVIKKSNKK